jgi:hypothetical protein
VLLRGRHERLGARDPRPHRLDSIGAHNVQPVDVCAWQSGQGDPDLELLMVLARKVTSGLLARLERPIGFRLGFVPIRGHRHLAVCRPWPEGPNAAGRQSSRKRHFASDQLGLMRQGERRCGLWAFRQDQMCGGRGIAPQDRAARGVHSLW